MRGVGRGWLSLFRLCLDNIILVIVSLGIQGVLVGSVGAAVPWSCRHCHSMLSFLEQIHSFVASARLGW